MQFELVTARDKITGRTHILLVIDGKVSSRWPLLGGLRESSVDVTMLPSHVANAVDLSAYQAKWDAGEFEIETVATGKRSDQP